jgi:uncharacterized NAD-dependent epimerase/dehydratase family protein
MTEKRRLVILAEGNFEFHHGKTAMSILRYRPEDVVAVIDSEHAGATTGDVVGLGGETPIVRDVTEALAHTPAALLIGVAPRGGGLPDAWRREILRAIEAGLDVISGLHTMLNDDPEFVAAARASGVTLHDVRRAPPSLPVASLVPRRSGSHVVTFVGSDCAVGKMTAALEITAAARSRGLSTAFVATGQTGIMLEGSGISIDEVVGDFMAGATEQMVVDACEAADLVFVEGQGSLLHPGYSGVTLALLHGSSPDALILVYQAGQTCIDHYPVAIPSLSRLIEIYEDAAGWIKPAQVVGIALNTRTLDEAGARHAIAQAQAETGLPTIDPVRFDANVLVDAVVESARRAAQQNRQEAPAGH